MKILAVVLMASLAAAPAVGVDAPGHKPYLFQQADAGKDGESGWSQMNRLKQEACVLTIIKQAPEGTPADVLDWNLQRCLLQNKVFI